MKNENEIAKKITPGTLIKDMNFKAFLDKKKSEIASVLPKILTVERMTRIVISEISTNQKLLACSLSSVMSSIMTASKLGLEIGSTLGHGYLVPYRDTCTFILGYRGMLDLARRSGNIESICARIVYENDYFDFEFGLDEKLKHVPNKEDRGRAVYAYAIAKFKGGGYQLEVMSIQEVNKIRARSKSQDNGPWVTDFEEMAKKTVIRRIFKYLPIATDVAQLVNREETVDLTDEKQSVEVELNPIFEEQEVKNQQQRLVEELANER